MQFFLKLENRKHVLNSIETMRFHKHGFNYAFLYFVANNFLFFHSLKFQEISYIGQCLNFMDRQCSMAYRFIRIN